MVTLNVATCPPFSKRTQRFQIIMPVDTDYTVEHLEKEILKKLERPSQNDDFDIIYCGKVLVPSSPLSSCKLQNHSTLLIVKRVLPHPETKSPHHPEGAASKPASVNKTEVLMAMHSALMSPGYRSITETMLNSSEALGSLISSVPGLEDDLSVLSMLQQPELLAVLLHKSSLDSLLHKHPAFGPAAIIVARAVTEESKKRGLTARTTENLTYLLDQMSDEEDDVPRAQQMRGNSGASNITTSQLAAAIQAVTGSGSMGGTEMLPSIPSTSQAVPGPSGSSTITSDFFQQAMAHAQSASTDAALQQLRDMGITDENVARQALAATGGDIQAAIDLIFGDGLM